MFESNPSSGKDTSKIEKRRPRRNEKQLLVQSLFESPPSSNLCSDQVSEGLFDSQTFSSKLCSAHYFRPIRRIKFQTHVTLEEVSFAKSTSLYQQTSKKKRIEEPGFELDLFQEQE